MSLALAYQRALAAVNALGVPGLGRLQHLDGDRDVVVQQRGEPVARGSAVEGRDRVADVALVLQQPGRRGLEARRPVGEGHDRQPGPRDVVLPELAHLVVEGARAVFGAPAAAAWSCVATDEPPARAETIPETSARASSAERTRATSEIVRRRRVLA